MDLDLEETTIAQLQARMASGALNALQLTQAYLTRIEAVDRSGPTLRSLIETNPDALEIAERLDRERAAGQVRGPLHGMPIVLKDNIDTADRMQTTAGSLALAGSTVEADAAVAHRLRTAGAVLLGKANLSEWANFRSTRSSSGWSARGRQTRNPFVLDRNPGGSSAGSAACVSANLCVAALGSETDGSIMSPSSACGVVGIKPTVGLTSRAGVIPISHSQDTVGPHARTLRDAATVLSAIAESGSDYTRLLDPDGLKNARIGISREFHTGYSEHTDRVFEAALDILRACGAELLDEVKIPGYAEQRGHFEGTDDSAETIVLEYELKADLEAYFATRPSAAVRTLADVIQFNIEHAEQELAYFGQERFLKAEARGPLSDELYQRALERNQTFARGFAAMFEEQRLNALVAPTNAPAWAIDLLDGDRFLGSASQASAVSGFPIVTVPAGYVAEVLPIGLSFLGPALSEPGLLRLAYAFEHAHPVRRAPRFRPTLLDLP